jgi:hypothetical protein
MYEGSIASVTPNVCRLFGCAVPEVCLAIAIDSVSRLKEEVLRDAAIERCLIYCPDALGEQIWSRLPECAARIAACAPQAVHLSSVVPPKTPVCFASMFTGAPPARHGIRKYERPVLRCDTLFDALLRVGKRIAIVAVQNSSVDLIFRDRKLDYFSEAYDRETTERALKVIAADEHELVVVYHQEYDDLLHKTQPHSDACLRAAENHVASFEMLSAAVRAAWERHNWAIIFAPDHGAHTDQATGHGDHGLDIPEDMSLRHWYGVWRGDMVAG